VLPSAVSGETEELALKLELFALSFTLRRRALNEALSRQGGVTIIDARPTPKVTEDSRSPVSSAPGMAPREGEISTCSHKLDSTLESCELCGMPWLQIVQESRSIEPEEAS